MRVFGAFFLSSLIACSGSPGATDAASDTAMSPPLDAASIGDTGGDGGASCGTAQPDLTHTSGTEGLAIARDGTIYYAVSGGVGRIAPDGTMNESYLSVGGPGATIWGLALDATNTYLYVCDPTTGHLHVATNLAGTPTVTPLATIAQPNGITIGNDGFIIVSDFGNNNVLRVDPHGGAISRVNTSGIPGANGVAFTDDGHLLVNAYAIGTVVSLALDASGRETSRSTVVRSVPNADGVAIDQNGVIYIGGGSTVWRIGPSGTPDMTLQMGHQGTANLEWGAGVLGCHDLYVASGDGLTRLPLTVGQRPVPWH